MKISIFSHNDMIINLKEVVTIRAYQNIQNGIAVDIIYKSGYKYTMYLDEGTKDSLLNSFFVYIESN